MEGSTSHHPDSVVTAVGLNQAFSVFWRHALCNKGLSVLYSRQKYFIWTTKHSDLPSNVQKIQGTKEQINTVREQHILRLRHSAGHTPDPLKYINVITQRFPLAYTDFRGGTTTGHVQSWTGLWFGQTSHSQFWGQRGKSEYGLYIRWVTSLLRWTGRDCSLKRADNTVTWKSTISVWGKYKRLLLGTEKDQSEYSLRN